MSKTTQVALLRGINVGRNKRIAMADLLELMHGLGYEDVRTHLQSGNVIYTSPAPPNEAAAAIEGQIGSKLGLTVKIIVRTRDELAQAIAANPLGECVGEPAKLLVTFLSMTPAPDALAAIDPAEFEPELFRVGGREIYSFHPNGLNQSRLSPALAKCLEGAWTARNWNTVSRLLELADS
jgi:uncharacterized protein (DUF1697 family)